MEKKRGSYASLVVFLPSASDRFSLGAANVRHRKVRLLAWKYD